MNFVLALITALMAVTASISVPSTPEASPVSEFGCGDLNAYFLNLAELTSKNEGFLTITSNPTGAFGLPADEVASVSESLRQLIDDLSDIEPPEAASLYHQAFVGQITWYFDLVTAPDFATYQRIVNRDRQLVPAISRAIFAGQSACGSEVWNDAYDQAFGDKT